MASANGEPIESAKRFELSMPESRNGTCAVEITLYQAGGDLYNMDVSHCPAKGIQDDRFGPEAHAQGLFELYIIPESCTGP
jgi:hypothetical protein